VQERTPQPNTIPYPGRERSKRCSDAKKVFGWWRRVGEPRPFCANVAQHVLPGDVARDSRGSFSSNPPLTPAVGSVSRVRSTTNNVAFIAQAARRRDGYNFNSQCWMFLRYFLPDSCALELPIKLEKQNFQKLNKK
jgi:hypothetical protein